MSIPYGYWHGKVSEYVAMLALTKLGFTVPVPRQEDHFGVDFIVHLASCEDDKTVIPTGRSFGVQIRHYSDASAARKCKMPPLLLRILTGRTIEQCRGRK
jgi:hypothetical protein